MPVIVHAGSVRGVASTGSKGPERLRSGPLQKCHNGGYNTVFFVIHTAHLGRVFRTPPPRSIEIGALGLGVASLSLSQVDSDAQGH